MTGGLSDADFAALVSRHRRSESRDQSDPQPRERGLEQARVDEVEYHQLRVLLLISAVGGAGAALDGLTKLAKLDFLLRYPVFLEIVANSLGLSIPPEIAPSGAELRAVESRMIRYKYGPWDDRYYAIIGALVGRGLVEYVPARGRVALRATDGGLALAQSISSQSAWELVAKRCDFLREHFRRFSGNKLKDLIYKVLPEVVDRPHRTEI